ncbi:MAG TPA: DUF547 domain-containing protein [Bryobacteraceae bacterium]|nr:DUF547 domain-containing protein [Bryobacteraceae bacterium]
MRLAFLSLLVPAFLNAASFDHSLWDRVLKASVNDIGEVDYAKLKGNADLERYVGMIEKSSPGNEPKLFPSKADELAYYINAYNALVMSAVVKKYPVKSIGASLLSRGSFFRFTKHTVGGEKINLEDLENKVLRSPKYAEPRIHFAIVCASLSCPELSRDAYTAANLEQQLEFQARQYFAETRNLSADPKSNTVTLPAIMDWYKADFEAFEKNSGKQALLAYALRYATPQKRAAAEGLKSPRIVFRDYDWSINDPGSRARAKTPEERELARRGP